jgi:hypothetical protein
VQGIQPCAFRQTEIEQHDIGAFVTQMRNSSAQVIDPRELGQQAWRLRQHFLNQARITRIIFN